MTSSNLEMFIADLTRRFGLDDGLLFPAQIRDEVSAAADAVVSAEDDLADAIAQTSLSPRQQDKLPSLADWLPAGVATGEGSAPPTPRVLSPRSAATIPEWPTLSRRATLSARDRKSIG